MNVLHLSCIEGRILPLFSNQQIASSSLQLYQRSHIIGVCSPTIPSLALASYIKQLLLQNHNGLILPIHPSAPRSNTNNHNRLRPNQQPCISNTPFFINPASPREQRTQTRQKSRRRYGINHCRNNEVCGQSG